MTDHRRFDAYVPRRLSAFGRGYSVFVRVLKYVLPLVALVIIGILFARLSGEHAQNASTMAQGEKTTPGQIELVGAKYEGVDDQGHPYTVTADRAVRDMSNAESMRFENPVADITLTDGTWLAVKSRSGFFDRTNETLQLDGGVTVFHDGGYEMTLEDININLRDRTASSEKPVSAQGPLGTIAAQNMTVSDQGFLITFGGPAVMKIFVKARG